MLHQPLDLEYWLVQIFSGNLQIFTFVGMLVITSMAAYFKMGLLTYSLFMLMFAVILKAMGASTLLIGIILIFAGIIIWWVRRLTE